MNIGYIKALQTEFFDCFIFHDVDLLPEDNHNLYDCPQDGYSRQMAILISSLSYKYYK